MPKFTHVDYGTLFEVGKSEATTRDLLGEMAFLLRKQESSSYPYNFKNFCAVQIKFGNNEPIRKSAASTGKSGDFSKGNHSEARALALAINEAIDLGYIQSPLKTNDGKIEIDKDTGVNLDQLSKFKDILNGEGVTVDLYTERQPCRNNTSLKGREFEPGCETILNTLLTKDEHNVYYSFPYIKEEATSDKGYQYYHYVYDDKEMKRIIMSKTSNYYTPIANREPPPQIKKSPSKEQVTSLQTEKKRSYSLTQRITPLTDEFETIKPLTDEFEIEVETKKKKKTFEIKKSSPKKQDTASPLKVHLKRSYESLTPTTDESKILKKPKISQSSPVKKVSPKEAFPFLPPSLPQKPSFWESSPSSTNREFPSSLSRKSSFSPSESKSLFFSSNLKRGSSPYKGKTQGARQVAAAKKKMEEQKKKDPILGKSNRKK